MNTARIGARYELAYKARQERLGYHVSARQAGSKGDFDLVAWGPAEQGPAGCWHIQLKAGRLSCARAYALNDTLRTRTGLPSTCGIVIVHRTREKEYCEH